MEIEREVFGRYRTAAGSCGVAEFRMRTYASREISHTISRSRWSGCHDTKEVQTDLARLSSRMCAFLGVNAAAMVVTETITRFQRFNGRTPLPEVTTHRRDILRGVRRLKPR